MMNFADHAIKFYLNLHAPQNLAENINVINPYSSTAVKEIVKNFFRKFYNDSNPRKYIFGINPGRFGAGTTGIGFTDPVALRKFCNVENDLGTRRELSSQFIYEMINAFGGTTDFFSKYFVSALYPLAIVKNGKNYNYYDENIIFASLKSEMIYLLNEQIKFGADKRIAFCLGKKNLKFLNELNSELNFFEKIVTLEHPRFIMQYRRKQLGFYIDKYLQTLRG